MTTLLFILPQQNEDNSGKDPVIIPASPPSRLLDWRKYPVFEQLGFVSHETNARFHMMLKEMQRDHNDISDREMCRSEMAIGRQAKKARLMFNPFTGEFRREGGV